MTIFQVTMKHSEETLECLSRMQYDLFCQRNRLSRMALSAGVILLGVWKHDAWWGILSIAYGCYLITSTYSSSNRTAHRLAQQIRAAGKDFPSSRFVFEKDAMHIFSLPEDRELNEPLYYSSVAGLGEDSSYYYIFCDQYGGFMIPKSQLGDKLPQFRDFIEKKSGRVFISSRSAFRRLLARVRRRENEPYHL